MIEKVSDKIEDLDPLDGPLTCEEMRLALGLLNKTLEDASEECCDEVKREGTLLLRAALNEKCEEAERLDDEVVAAKEQVESLLGELGNAKDQILTLDAEIEILS
jgi:hypothetical protein